MATGQVCIKIEFWPFLLIQGVVCLQPKTDGSMLNRFIQAVIYIMNNNFVVLPELEINVTFI